MTVEKNIIKISLLLFVISILCFFSELTATAATSDAAYYLSFVEGDKELYGEKYAPAQKLSNGEIQPATGEISIDEIDVSLPGKNGLDLNIHRIYSSQETKHQVEYAYSTSKYIFAVKKAYVYTIMDGSDKQILVSFDKEEDMVDSFYSDATKISKNHKEDCYGTEYQTYASLKNTSGTILLERDKNQYMEELYKESTRGLLVDNKGEGNINLSTDNREWKIAMPYLYRIGTTESSSRKMHYYRFGNEKGEVYTLKFSVITEEDYEEPYGAVFSEKIYSAEHTISIIFNEESLTHTLLLTDKEGKIYTFELGDVINTATRKITDAKITDRYGNSIVYSNTGIIDSYGRRLRVSENGIEIFDGRKYKYLVKYEVGEIYDQERDPQGLLTIFTKTQLSVLRNTSLLSDDEDEFEETIYITQARETDASVDYYENSPVSLLNEVIYSDGQKIIYTYEADCDEEKEPTNFYSDSYIYMVPRVSSKSEYIKNGNAYTEKTSRTFGYTKYIIYTGVTVSSELTGTSENLTINGKTQKTIRYKFDFADRMLEREEYKGVSDKRITRFLYKQPSTIMKVDEIERDEYISFRQTPVSAIVTTEGGIVVDTAYYEYTRDRKPLLIQKGLQIETYQYDQQYGFVVEHTKSIDAGRELRTVNIKTADGKNIAQTQIFEVVDGVEYLRNTIAYTYNTDGTVASETTASGGTVNYTYDYSLFNNYENGKHRITASVVTRDARNTSRTETTLTEFDLLGNIKKETDGNGHVTGYTYDLMGRIVEENYADGTTRKVEYDEENRTVTVTEPDGHKLSYEYNEDGNLTKAFLPDAGNQVLNVNVYDAQGRKVKTTAYIDAQNTVSEEYEYDVFNRLIKKTELQNSVLTETVNYDIENSAERVTLSTDSSSKTVTLNGEYSYAIVIAKPSGSYDLSYDPYILVTVDGVSKGTKYGYFDDVIYSVYDLTGANSVSFNRRMPGDVYALLVKNENVGTGSGVGVRTVTATFTGDESFVRPKEITKFDYAGYIISSEYRENTTNEVLKRDEYEYDYMGNMTEYRDSKVTLENIGEYTTRTEYNFLGLPTREINAAGNYKSYTYDNLGRLLTATDETGVTTTHTYDVVGRELVSETNITDTDKARTERYYDSNGNIIRERTKKNALGSADEYKEITYEYDNMNRLTTVKLDDSSYTYKNSGQAANENYSSVYTQYLYDDMGNVTKVLSGHISKHDFSETTPDEAVVTSYEYDRFGNVIRVTDTAGKSETATYNLMGLPVTTTDRKGITTTYTYNAYGSPLTVSTAGMDTITYTYNVNNVLLKAEQGDDVITYEYDSLGRVTKETENGIVKTYQTDRVGNITYAEIAGEGTTYTYDNLNRITGASFNGGSASYTYDDAGRLTGEAKGGITTVYTYNPAGWLSSKTNSDGTETDTYILTYYSDGNLHTKTENGIATTYVYDGRGQLIRENDIIYTYDTRGNRSGKVDGNTTICYTYNTDNALSREEYSNGTVIGYVYDANGNNIRKSVFSEYIDGEGQSQSEITNDYIMTYDPLNRMTSYSSSDVNATYTYGIDNMRRSKTVNGVTTNYIWDGGNIVAEADSENTITNRYFRGIGLIASKTGNNISYYQTNSHGDVSKWGAVDYSYDAFGNETTASNGNNPFRYNGEYQDLCSGLIYLRNRYYDPSIGRFITEDPARDGLNWYVYCSNNPINRIDPSGLKDYIYTSQTEYYVENDWGFWEFLNTDRYYAEIEGSRYQANSKETVTLYDWSSFDTKFLNETLDSLVDKANEKATGIKRILSESVGGDLDFKLQMEKETLYLANGVLYNRNEAGNYVWAYYLESQNVSGYISGALAQGGSLIPPLANMDGLPRLDEEWDRKARWSGIKYYYDRNNQWWIYYALYGGRTKY